MFGPINEVNSKMSDLTARELAYLLPLVVSAFWIGLYPKPIMDVLRQPVQKLVQQVNPSFYLSNVKLKVNKEAIAESRQVDVSNQNHSLYGGGN
jgi:ATP-dependent protease Clp ATPase subunit